jgi:hypothetical protein
MDLLQLDRSRSLPVFVVLFRTQLRVATALSEFRVEVPVSYKMSGSFTQLAQETSRLKAYVTEGF